APWQERQAGVYDCRWGTDEVRVLVAGDLPREVHNAPLHLFSASPEVLSFGQSAYQRRSKTTSLLLGPLFESLNGEVFAMPYTMEDFKRDYVKGHFAKLTPEEQRQALERLSPEQRQQVLQSLPAEERLAGLSEEEIRHYLERLTADRSSEPRKPR